MPSFLPSLFYSLETSENVLGVAEEGLSSLKEGMLADSLQPRKPRRCPLPHSGLSTAPTFFDPESITTDPVSHTLSLCPKNRGPPERPPWRGPLERKLPFPRSTLRPEGVWNDETHMCRSPCRGVLVPSATCAQWPDQGRWPVILGAPFSDEVTVYNSQLLLPEAPAFQETSVILGLKNK